VSRKKSEDTVVLEAVRASPAGLEGVALVQRVVELVNKVPGRPTDAEGKPGGLILFPPQLRPIIIGDLHSAKDHLIRILEHENNPADLKAGRAALIFVGDALHDERTGYMKQMRSSVEILDYIFEIFLRYPGSVYYLKGNHDTFDERLRKSGILQGVEFKKELLDSHGPEYVQAVAEFFDSLPLFLIGDGFVVTHAGPPRGGLVREELVNIKKYPEKMHQLMWNRVNEFHGNPSLKEYGEKELRLVLRQLDLPEDTPFIVGHNPIWNDGNQTGVWMNVIGIKNHHILYSGYGSKAPYFTVEKGELIVKFAMPKQAEVYYFG